MNAVQGAQEGSELPSHVMVGESAPIGRGVFARRDFAPGDLIETAPVIIIPADQWQNLEKTILFSYCYAFGDRDEDMALALGFGSLYNHSYTPNARYVKDPGKKLIAYYAVKRIDKDQEITINYNGDPYCLDPLWFNVIK